MTLEMEQREDGHIYLKGENGDVRISKLSGEDIGKIKYEVAQLLALRKENECSELVAKYICRNEDIISIKQDLNPEMWSYEDGIRKPNAQSKIKEICRILYGEAYTPQRANKVIAKIEADTYMEADTFFRAEQENKFEQPVLNGILNIQHIFISPFTKDKIFFNKINANYDQTKDCPAIKKFLLEVLETPEDMQILFEIIGGMLYKKYFPQIAVMFLGEGENGKGVVQSLIRRFLGVENCSSLPLNQMTSDSFSVCELFGKLANLSGDISNTDLQDTGRFKELCSGTDMIASKRKFQRDLFFINYAKLIFSCNELPKSYDLSHGFWRRWLILSFKNTFLKQREYDLLQDKTNVKLADPDILEKLTTPDEMSGLLNEALKGLHRLFENKQYSYAKSTSEVKDFWIRKSDSFTAFCLDCLEESSEGFISKKDLRKVFNHYCKKHKVKGAGDKNIKSVLENMFGVSEGRKTIGASFERDMVWEGVRFKPNNESVKEVNGFSTLYRINNSPIGSNTLDTLDTLDKLKKEEQIEVQKFK